MLYKATMIVDHCTQHEQNPLIHIRYITTNIQNLENNGHKYYILAQRQGIFYMHQVPIVFITVPNMNINPFISEILQQTHKMLDKYCHNYSNLA